MQKIIAAIFGTFAKFWVFTKLWKAILSIVGIFVPMGKKVLVSRQLWWLFHPIAVLVALYGLYRLQHWLQTKGMPLRAPFPSLQDYWLVILGLVFYAMTWIAWWIWKLLVDDVPSYHPDIDAAWGEGMRALRDAGIDLRNRPLFLILGRPESGERNLFDAAQLTLEVKPTPADPRAPLRICADSTSIYVTCVGVSLLGRLAGIYALEEMGQGESAVSASAAVEDVSKTLVPKKHEKQIVEDLEEFGKSSTTLQRRRLRRAAQLPLGPDFMADPVEVRRRNSRLAHLCHLIVRDREPFAPINAVMMLVPLGGTDTDRDAQQTAEAAQRDLETIRNVFQLECPLLTVMADMETLPGFGNFMEGQTPEDKKRRFGQRFPLASNLRREQTVEQIRDSIAFLSNDYVQQSIAKYFQFEKAEKPAAERAGADKPAARRSQAAAPPVESSETAETGLGTFFEGNAALVLLMDEMRMRAEPLERIIQQAVAGDGYLWRYAGCYLAATGDRGQQAFVPQLFERLFKELRNCVNWTNEIWEYDQRCHTHRKIGYLLVTAAWAITIAWAVWHFKFRGGI